MLHPIAGDAVTDYYKVKDKLDYWKKGGGTTQRHSAQTTRKTTKPDRIERSNNMSIGMILMILLILVLVGALPTWPHSKSWGYYPSSGLGFVVLILLVLVFMGRI